MICFWMSESRSRYRLPLMFRRVVSTWDSKNCSWVAADAEKQRQSSSVISDSNGDSRRSMRAHTGPTHPDVLTPEPIMQVQQSNKVRAIREAIQIALSKRVRRGAVPQCVTDAPGHTRNFQAHAQFQQLQYMSIEVMYSLSLFKYLWAYFVIWSYIRQLYFLF